MIHYNTVDNVFYSHGASVQCRALICNYGVFYAELNAGSYNLCVIIEMNEVKIICYYTHGTG